MFSFYYDFSQRFFSSISEYALSFVNFMFTDIEILNIATISPFELVFSVFLYNILTFGIIKFVIDIWP